MQTIQYENLNRFFFNFILRFNKIAKRCQNPLELKLFGFLRQAGLSDADWIINSDCGHGGHCRRCCCWNPSPGFGLGRFRAREGQTTCCGLKRRFDFYSKLISIHQAARALKMSWLVIRKRISAPFCLGDHVGGPRQDRDLCKWREDLKSKQ